MKFLLENVVHRQEIEKSRFITYLFFLEKLEEEKQYLKQVKAEHPKATHHCVGMIFDDVEKGNDDGEPGGTAKIPILQALKKYRINNVLCVVVRYFGGKKLGVGGLTRAYFSSVEKAILEVGELRDIKYLPSFTIDCHYQQYSPILNYLKEEIILGVDFQLRVKIEVLVSNRCLLDVLSQNFLDITIHEGEVVKYFYR